MKRFAFILDPLEKLDLPWDTSLCLLRELNRRGHQTYSFMPSGISSRQGEVVGMGFRLQPSGTTHRYSKGGLETLKLRNFDALFIRKDPPFNPSYLTLTYLLEPLAKKLPVINDPKAIRDANEKIFILNFPRWCPPTLVSSRSEEILGFQGDQKSDLVIKPLFEKGGKGVFLLRGSLRQKKILIGKALRKTETLIAQTFIPVARGKGDKRILLWKGELLGAFERIPPAGDFRTNLSLGGHFQKCALSLREKKLARDLAPKLERAGLYFTGLDVRGEWLIELNVTSPAGLVELDQLYGQKATRRLADSL